MLHPDRDLLGPDHDQGRFQTPTASSLSPDHDKLYPNRDLLSGRQKFLKSLLWCLEHVGNKFMGFQQLYFGFFSINMTYEVGLDVRYY